MSGIRTNRDLYLAIADMTGRQRSGTRGLEEYLRALWGAACRQRGRTSLSGDEFFALLDAGFTLPAPPFDEAWRSGHPGNETSPLLDCLAAKMGAAKQHRGPGDGGDTGFGRWESFLLRQVVDLREMEEQGMLQNELRYFGINSPRGQRWYNFDPCTFLECAAAGAYGGWQSGDDTGREHVPGQVVHMGEDGTLTTADPEEIPDPVEPVAEVSWDDFRSFLGCGQWYE
jgi:hypothetical protein